MQVVLYCDNRMGATPVKCTYSQTIGTQFSDSMQVVMMMLMMLMMLMMILMVTGGHECRPDCRGGNGGPVLGHLQRGRGGELIIMMAMTMIMIMTGE